jgi:hypothetical protein
MENVKRRAEILLDIFQTRGSFERWLEVRPRSLARLLGFCEEGESALQDNLGRAILALLSGSRREGLAESLDRDGKGKEKMADEKDRTQELIAKGIQQGLTILDRLSKEKKKAAKLLIVIKEWEKAGLYKDLLIDKLIHDGSDGKKRKAALACRELLQTAQTLLKKIREKIENGDEAREEAKQLETTLGNAQRCIIGL